MCDVTRCPRSRGEVDRCPRSRCEMARRPGEVRAFFYTQQNMRKFGYRLFCVGFHRPAWLWLGGKRYREKSQLAAILNAQSARHGDQPGPKLACSAQNPPPLRAPQPRARERPAEPKEKVANVQKKMYPYNIILLGKWWWWTCPKERAKIWLSFVLCGFLSSCLALARRKAIPRKEPARRDFERPQRAPRSPAGAQTCA